MLHRIMSILLIIAMSLGQYKPVFGAGSFSLNKSLITHDPTEISASGNGFETITSRVSDLLTGFNTIKNSSTKTDLVAPNSQLSSGWSIDSMTFTMQSSALRGKFDFTKDKVVDTADVTAVQNKVTAGQYDAAMDFNGDSVLDNTDVAILQGIIDFKSKTLEQKTALVNQMSTEFAVASLTAISTTSSGIQTTADILEGLDTAKAVAIISSSNFNVSRIGKIMRYVDTAKAIELVSALDTKSAASILTAMEKSGSSTTTTTAAAILSGMDTAKAKDILSADSLKPDVAGNILAKVDTQKAVGLLDSLSQDKTVAILNAMGGVVKNSYGLFGSRFGLLGVSSIFSRIFGGSATGPHAKEAAAILQAMDPAKAKALVEDENLNAKAIGAIFSHCDPQNAADMIKDLDDTKAAQILTAMPRTSSSTLYDIRLEGLSFFSSIGTTKKNTVGKTTSAQVIGCLDASKAAAIIVNGGIKPNVAGAMLKNLDANKTAAILADDKITVDTAVKILDYMGLRSILSKKSGSSSDYPEPIKSVLDALNTLNADKASQIKTQLDAIKERYELTAEHGTFGASLRLALKDKVAAANGDKTKIAEIKKEAQKIYDAEIDRINDEIKEENADYADWIKGMDKEDKEFWAESHQDTLDDLKADKAKAKEEYKEFLDELDSKISSPSDTTSSKTTIDVTKYVDSTSMMTDAWKYYNKNDYTNVKLLADEVIKRYTGTALQQQASLTAFAPSSTAAQYWALNDVATAHFILGKIYKKQGDSTKAEEEKNIILDQFKYAQCWDTQGWFWKVADAAQKEL